jgi:hypothetical protein
LPVAEKFCRKPFLSQARYHGVAALVFHLLKSTDSWDDLPEQLKDGLLLEYRTKAVIEMMRSRDLNALQEVFKKADISILLLKGGALAYSHYPEPWLRSRGDTDIFIDLRDIQQTQDLFLDLDYQFNGPVYKSH